MPSQTYYSCHPFFFASIFLPTPINSILWVWVTTYTLGVIGVGMRRSRGKESTTAPYWIPTPLVDRVITSSLVVLGTGTGTCNKVLVAKKKIFLCCWDAAGVATSQPKPTKNYGPHCSRLGLTYIWGWTMTMMTARPSSPPSPRGSYEEVNDVTRKLRGTGPCGIWH